MNDIGSIFLEVRLLRVKCSQIVDSELFFTISFEQLIFFSETQFLEFLNIVDTKSRKMSWLDVELNICFNIFYFDPEIER